MALLPPDPIQNAINRIKQHFAEHYNSRKALNSPPHITLQPPFLWPPKPALSEAQNSDRETRLDPERNASFSSLEHGLRTFSASASPVPIYLSGFAAFPTRVIYINVIQNHALLNVQSALQHYCWSAWRIGDKATRKRSFTPHITVAFRDLSRADFRKGWAEFQSQSFEAEFTVNTLTLLKHNGQAWESHQTFLLQG